MAFNSLSYAIFFTVCFFIYWCIPQKFKWLILMIFSYYFYMCWNVKYVILIFTTSIISFLCGLYLEKVKNPRVPLVLTILSSLGILFIFKYLNFAINSINEILGLCGINRSISTTKLLLPVGISYYTFKTLSYVIDVYRGDIKAEHHFGIYATYVSFFPQLVAGPIERASNFIPQLKSKKCFDEIQAEQGIQRILVGLIKKIVVADTLAKAVDTIYGSVNSYQGCILLLTSFLFSIQIFCDFSGYSDIAIGCAKLLGFDLMNNFDNPYLSSSLNDFWKRWHISLSSWFKDYVYIPLGGNRKGKLRTYINLFVTFLLSGLWHGANWTYVIWGAIHGVGQIIEKQFFRRKASNGLGRVFRVILTFLFVNMGWIFFRAESLHDAIYYFKNMFVGISSPFKYISQLGDTLYFRTKGGAVVIAEIIIMFVADYISEHNEGAFKVPTLLRWSIYVLSIVFIVFFASKGITTEFIYFQF